MPTSLISSLPFLRQTPLASRRRTSSPDTSYARLLRPSGCTNKFAMSQRRGRPKVPRSIPSLTKPPLYLLHARQLLGADSGSFCTPRPLPCPPQRPKPLQWPPFSASQGSLGRRCLAPLGLAVLVWKTKILNHLSLLLPSNSGFPYLFRRFTLQLLDAKDHISSQMYHHMRIFRFLYLLLDESIVSCIYSSDGVR